MRFLKILSGKVREKHTCQVWTTMFTVHNGSCGLVGLTPTPKSGNDIVTQTNQQLIVVLGIMSCSLLAVNSARKWNVTTNTCVCLRRQTIQEGFHVTDITLCHMLNPTETCCCDT